MVRSWIAAVALGLIAATAHAQEDYTVVKGFAIVPPYDTSVKPSPLVLGRDGNFYGSNGFGFFRVTPDGSFSELGHGLLSAIAIDGGDGFFYTVTRPLEGTAIVKFTEGGSPTTLYQFTDVSHGALIDALLQGTDRQIYGSIRMFSDTVSARLFRLTTAGVFTVLHEFPYAEGAHATRLILGRDGHFYGVTGWRVFRLTTSGTITTVHAFTSDVSPQRFLLEASDGSLYGSTLRGGRFGAGFVFRILSGGGFTVVYDFPGQAVNGISGLSAPLIEGTDGALYGTSEYVIFRLTPGGDLRILHSTSAEPSWAGSDRYGTFFSGVLEGANGDLYGSAENFGPAGDGAIFRLNRQRLACINIIKPVWQANYGGTLYLLGAVKAERPAFYATWLVTDTAVTPLWTGFTAAIDPSFAFELQGALPSGGTVGIYSLLITSTLDVCTSWDTTATGTGVTPAELQLRLQHAISGVPRQSR
jgi:uncharacterized repeat protein (TIGR03803 family)